MKVSVIVNSTEDLARVLGSHEVPNLKPASGTIDVDWSTWIENKKQEHNISWIAFSEQCDITIEQVWRYRHKMSEPSPKSILKMVRAFGG